MSQTFDAKTNPIKDADKKYFNIVLKYGDELESFSDIGKANDYLANNPNPDEAFAEDSDCEMQAEFDASSGVLVQF